MVSPLEGSPITAEFDPDGTMSGSSGCNTYTADYEVSGNAFRIATLVNTERACEPRLMRQETHLPRCARIGRAMEVLRSRLPVAERDGHRGSDLRTRVNGCDLCGERGPKQFEGLGVHAEEGPSAALLTLDEPCVGQHPEVVAHGRLRQAERLGQVADARFPFSAGADDAQETESCRIGEHPEGCGEEIGIRLVERFREHRRAACGVDRLDEATTPLDDDRCLNIN